MVGNSLQNQCCIITRIMYFSEYGESKISINMANTFFIFSSKKIILQHWKDTEAPSILHWKNLMKYYLNMGKPVMEGNNKRKIFLQVWSLIYDSL